MAPGCAAMGRWLQDHGARAGAEGSVEASLILRALAGTGWGWALGRCLLAGMTCWFRTGSDWQREGAAKWRKGDSEVGLA